MSTVDSLPPGAMEQAVILIADDHPINRSLIVTALGKAGFRRLLVAGDGCEALAIAEASVPDCIVLDIMMPQMDGWTVCRTLRSDPRFRHVPIIVQSALSSAEDRRMAFALGASDMVTKPFDPQELIARVRVHVANRLLSTGLLAYRERLNSELQEARAVAESLLPEPEDLAVLAGCGVDVDFHHRSSSEVGGDYFGAWPTSDGQVALFVGDVSGHGVSAALRAFRLNALLVPSPPFIGDLRAAAAHLDDRLHRFGQREAQFVAGTLVLYEPCQGSLRYLGAGLRDGMILRADGRIDLLAMSGMPFGLSPGLTRPVRESTLAPGDTLLLYTDALVESADATGAPVDEEDLVLWVSRTLDRIGRTEPERLATRIADAFLADYGAGVQDDLLVVSAHARPVP